MTLTDTSAPRIGPSLPRPGRTVLTAAALVSLIGLLIALAGLAIDGRIITGSPAWLKPAKFGVSITIYSVTLGAFLSLVHGRTRLVRVIGWSTAVALIGELALIGVQVVRGTTSHFNDATAFDAAVFSAMGALIVVAFLGAVGAAALLLRERSLDRTLASGIRGGLAAAVVGMAEAGLMLANRAHTVGAPDGGPGLPVMGWSTEHGDLRIAHFVGIHGLQAVPLLAWVLLRYAPTLTEQARVWLVRVATTGLLALVGVLAWQAERGLPLLRPDTPVVATFGVVALLAVAALILVLRTSRRPA